MYYYISDAEYGYRIINLSEDGENVCAKMNLKYMNNVINLSYVECNCASLKGRCFEMFMNILFMSAHNGELFHQEIRDLNTSVELFVEPLGSNKEAIHKLKKMYSKYGFIEDASLENFMQSTLAKIGVKKGIGGGVHKRSRKRNKRSYALRKRSSRRLIS